jgi:hypothetical protein
MKVKPVLQRKYVAYLLTILASHDQRKNAYRWLRSLKGNHLLEARIPWITFHAIDYLERWLQGNAPRRMFEYGSGGSTFFWLKHDGICVSIEHDPQWFELVRRRIGFPGNLDYRLVLPEMAVTITAADVSEPTQYLSGDRSFQGYTFKDYVCQIDHFPEEYFDAVLIDGRARPSCIMHSAHKVKLGGLLILDNADVSYYTAKTQVYLQDFVRIEFSGVGPCLPWMWRTDVYVRKK